VNPLLVRIDDRLIHGQVIVGWARSLGVNCIVVANDEFSHDEFQKELVAMACPPNMEILILGVEEAISKFKGGEFEDKRTILLLDTPKDALRLIKEGVKISEINVGGMRSANDRIKILPWVFLNEEEISIFRQIRYLGVKLEARAVPTDPKVDLLDLIEKAVTSHFKNVKS